MVRVRWPARLFGKAGSASAPNRNAKQTRANSENTVSDIVTINKDFARRLASAVRRITSNMPEEADTAAQAVVRLLLGASKDETFGVAERIENESNGTLSDAEMKEIFDAGVEHGKKLGAQAQA